MLYGSVCSGIEAASVAWEPLGWEPEFFSEIAAFPSAVLKHRYPGVPNLGDFTRIENTPSGRRIDLLVGGTPCQSFSIAGLRGGLGDDRGNLALEYFRLADRLRPQWLLWENVPGVLSSHGGRDFGSILGAMVELGYGFAYRVLDAQHFGVPQRRRRVFLVGHLGDWRRAAAVLFDAESLRRDPAAGRKAREDVAGTLGGGSGSRGWCNDLDRSGAFVPVGGGNFGRPVAHTTTTHQAKGGDPTTDNYVVSIAQNQQGAVVAAPVTQALASGGGIPSQGYAAVAFRPRESAERMKVRRLTPRECERLQGLPDDWTLVPWKKGMAPDGPRYAAVGNSFAVPAVRWIGERIQMVEGLK